MYVSFVYESKNLLDRLTADFPGACISDGVGRLNDTEVTEVRKAGRCRRRDTYSLLGGIPKLSYLYYELN